MPAIMVSNLRKHYGDVTALDDLSFEVPEGCVYGFVGPNGAGKTTTMRIICCLTRPSSGDVEVLGYGLDRPYKIKELVGYLPENLQLYQSLTVEEHIKLMAMLNGLSFRELRNRVETVIEMFKLGSLRNRRCGALSQGQKRRVGLAMAMVHDPSLIILDEPTSGLDPIARSKLLELISRLGNLGKTVLLSSHVLPEIIDICTHVGVINNGRMLYSGPIDGLKPKGHVMVKILVSAMAEQLEARLRRESWVLSVQRFGRKLTVSVIRRRDACTSLVRLISEVGAPLESFQVSGVDVEFTLLNMLKGGQR